MSKDSSSSVPPPILPSSAGIEGASTEPRIADAVFTIFMTILLFISAQFVGIIIVYTILSFVGLSTDDIETLFSDNVWAQFAGILIIELITVGLLFVYHKYKKINFLKAVGLSSKPTKNIFLAVGLTYGLYFVTFIAALALADGFIPSLDTDQVQQLGFESPVGLELIAVFATLVILPSVAEEILFRGFLFQKLEKYISLAPAAIMTSIVFGAAHLELLGGGPPNFIAALDTLVFSFFLILVFRKTSSLWSSILLHAVKNSIAFVFLFII